jgi:hypothetical protein
MSFKDRIIAFVDTVSITNILGTLFFVVVTVAMGFAILNRLSGDETLTDPQNDVRSSATTSSTLLPEEEQAAPPEPFYVVGSKIVDPDGNVFLAVGVNAAISAVDFPYVFEGGNGGVNDHLDAVQAWEWNTVRATLDCYNETGSPLQQDVIDGIDETVREFTAAGVVVILTCQDSTGQNLALDSPLEIELREFWDVVVEKYRDNPYVWFNFFNEPFEAADLESWQLLHQFYVDRFRSAGVENIMVLDLPIFGQGIELAATDDFADTLGAECNTVLGWHAWGAINDTEATPEAYDVNVLTVLGKGLAVLIGEAGVPDPLDAGTAGNPEWNASGFYSAIEVAEQRDIGMLWWHGTGDTVDELYYPLTADATGFWTAADGTNLSTAGERFRRFSNEDRPVEAFVGDLAESGCPSATGEPPTEPPVEPVGG